MAKIEGDQNIPSALLDPYRATLTEKQPDDVGRKRYPYRVPHMQKDGADVKAGQLAQRTRFLLVRDEFNKLSDAEKARWYAARPPWSSFLWYYNYFIMSGLMDVLGANPEGASVINTIKHYTFTLPAGGPANVNIPISTINADKAAVFFYGAGWQEVSENIGVAIYPYLVSLTHSTCVAKASGAIEVNVGCSLSVIEYI